MSFTTTLSYNDQSVLLVPGKMTFFDELYVDYKVETKNNSTRITMMIHPKQKVTLKKLTLERSCNFSPADRIFCNGFQSWSESREYRADERIQKLMSLAKSKLQYYGDTHFDFIKRDKGHFHSWTYGYVRKGKKIDFIGSLNERTAFTILQYDRNKNTVSIEKECESLEISHSFPILDIFIAEGQESWVFNEYFNAMDTPPIKAPKLTGWTSWYNYYTDISEEIILKNADAFVEKKAPIDIIQIDDGYQKYIGDWLQIKSSFPNGMQHVAQQIKSKGFKAGIWMAPFVCETASDIFKTKQHWLLKDKDGNPIKAGYTPLWGGWFYALNFYNKEVQDYLMGVFKIALEKWGYDLVKLDFLYAACIQPPPNKTRGQMMNDAMEFLRRTVGNKWILGCGVPLGAAFGKVDYCRIGADIHLKWEHNFLKFIGNRERVSTILALRSVLGRWQLNGRVFHNDPDVILLRDKNIKLTSTQQFTVLIINTLLGDLIFTSDYIAEYSEEQYAEFLNIYKWRNSEIKSVELVEFDLYLIRFRNDNMNWVCACNLTKKTRSVVIGKQTVKLEGFESMILSDKG